jgi:hypothetical protein
LTCGGADSSTSANDRQRVERFEPGAHQYLEIPIEPLRDVCDARGNLPDTRRGELSTLVELLEARLQ